MVISITKKIELSEVEKMTLRQAKQILVDLALELDDDYYEDLADKIEEVYLHQSWDLYPEEVY